MGKETEEGSTDVRKLVFGKYEMGRVLGKGTFGKVYYARELSSGESVAIKVIDKDQIRRQGGMMEQIQREIAVMRLVRHPNVVELREVMATRSRIFFVMEYVRGGELFARIVRGRLTEDQARRYFHQLISAIDFCHSRGVSHRDLKPENLLLDANGDLKVSDFGLSALPEQLRHDGLLHTQCGTPAYVAPEILRSRGYDGAKADLWSCGVILFALLAGFLPFQDESLMKMYRKVSKADYQIPPWFSSEARRLVSRLLVVDPNKRISIPAIKQLPWFKKGCRRPAPIQIPPSPQEEEKGKPATPRFYNAFELISSMSSGFDLSSLFENRRKTATVFTSRSAATAIVERLGSVGRALGFIVERAKSCKVKIQGKTEGRKGHLELAAEVFEVAAGVAVVEITKSSGDTLEYAKFCEDFTKSSGDTLEYAKFCEDVRPGLKDIVWTWQGDDAIDGGNEQRDGHRW
ncbi:CBL-interacting serine/threonine-protein kinase 5-like isoform X3 [Canna indica]|uniref:non-specific serine/threonine protein kinase n=1 Tax=Canna indica TaxID=4628 RepID=A0AAQ3KSN3_9LILI|nr:CBL-interacting serine/threonine-protein kinase 5-like isoform X3 [Canna indica]